MSTLLGVDEFVLPLRLVDRTLELLRRAGSDGYEAFVLLGGRIDDGGKRFAFTSAYFPEQTTTQSSDGLLVVVKGDALFRVNRAFYERNLVLAAQIHSHPTDAYHSGTDDSYPLMTLLGGLSGVVPNFGRAGRDGLPDWAWYRLTGPGQWRLLARETKITVVDNDGGEP